LWNNVPASRPTLNRVAMRRRNRPVVGDGWARTFGRSRIWGGINVPT
jgi:hypothetical protein